jgi:sec-independent protein translocase protein TatB
MFDLDMGKMVLFGGVALVVIGPKELPAALRLAGRVVAQVRRVQGDIRKAADTLMADTSLEREIARLDLARNPATAMRGRLSNAPVLAEAEMEYASPEMQAYLAPPPEAPSADPALGAP